MNIYSILNTRHKLTQTLSGYKTPHYVDTSDTNRNLYQNSDNQTNKTDLLRTS